MSDAGGTVAEQAPPGLQERAAHRVAVVRRSQLLPLILLWIAVIVYFALTQDRFLREANITAALEQNAALFMVAMAETVILLTGAVDLSAGGLLALTGLVVTISNNGVPPWLAVIATILAGGVISGVLNGLPIGLARMNPFVVTLGTASIFFGISNVITDGNTQVINDPALINTLASDKVGPFPVAVLLMLGVLLLFAWMLRFTYLGRNFYAVGGNPEAATLAGISVARIRILAFVLLGLATGLAAVLDAGQLSSVAPTSGTGLELQAIAAVLLGGTSLMGGKGGVLGTAIAVLFLGTLQNGLDVSGVSTFWQSIVTGAVLVLAVGFDQARERFAVGRQVKGTA
jgi:ribose/xylose/arabinose/galactoside ABC-type transport system permease subunit